MSKQSEFIKAISELARYEYTTRDKAVKPSICISQAALESGWNLNAKTLFGIKGAGISLSTKEWNGNEFETVRATFKAYPNLASSVKGYYDLMSKARYSKVVSAYTIDKACEELQKSGYATDPNYGVKVLSIIHKYNLTQYDTILNLSSNNGIKHFYNHDFKVGDKVRFSTCYASSTDPTSRAIPSTKMKKNYGTITKVRENCANPYLLDGGLCWVNKGDIREILN